MTAAPTVGDRVEPSAFISASTRHRMPGRYLGDSVRDAARVVEAALVR